MVSDAGRLALAADADPRVKLLTEGDEELKEKLQQILK